jgi:hypothetical protein
LNGVYILHITNKNIQSQEKNVDVLILNIYFKITIINCLNQKITWSLKIYHN